MDSTLDKNYLNFIDFKKVGYIDCWIYYDSNFKCSYNLIRYFFIKRIQADVHFDENFNNELSKLKPDLIFKIYGNDFYLKGDCLFKYNGKIFENAEDLFWDWVESDFRPK